MKTLNKKAFAVVEYVMVFVIVILAFVVLKSYIQRSIFGISAQSGQSFAYGRQYDPQRSIDCAFDGNTQYWYDVNCFNNLKCSLGDYACEQQCPGSTCNQLCEPTYCSTACGAGTDNCGNPCTGTLC